MTHERDRESSASRPSQERLRQRERSGRLLARQVAAEYTALARLDPEAVSAYELKVLRLSPHGCLRAAAVLLWSRRRPGPFLRAAPRFLADADVEVRAAVMEGVANSAMVMGTGGEAAQVRELLEKGRQDTSQRVREQAEQAIRLLDLGE